MEANLTLPYDLAAEQSLLGAILTDSEALEKIVGRIKPDHFFQKDHQEVFKAIMDLTKNRKPTDLISVAESLKGRKTLDKIGGLDYLSELAGSVINTSNVAYYVEIIVNKYQSREVISAASKVISLAYEEKSTISAITALNEAAMAGERTKIKTIYDIASEIVDGLGTYEQGHTPKGLEIGWESLDRALGGLHPQEFIVIAGRTSMGKTAFALEVSLKLSSKNPLLFFSLEMSERQQGQRLLANTSGINSFHFRRNVVREYQLDCVAQAAILLGRNQLYLSDSIYHIDDIIMAAHAAHREHQLKVIVIDYVQIIQHNEKTIREGMVKITASLKRLAKDLNIPVIGLAQVSRAVDGRADKHPFLSDLKESGSLEQDADIVIFLHRPEYYDKGADPDLMEVDIAKHRNGGHLGLLEFKYDRGTNSFSEKKSI